MKEEAIYFEVTTSSYMYGERNIRTKISSRDEMRPYLKLINFILFENKDFWNYENGTELVKNERGEWKSVSKAVNKYGKKFGKKIVETFNKKYLHNEVVDRINSVRFLIMKEEQVKFE